MTVLSLKVVKNFGLSSVNHVSRREQDFADAQSRVSVSNINAKYIELNNFVEDYVICSVKALPATEEKLS